MNQSPGNNLIKIEIHAKGLFNSAIFILGVYHKQLIKVNNKIVKNYKARFSTRSLRLLNDNCPPCVVIDNRLENCRGNKGILFQSHNFSI